MVNVNIYTSLILSIITQFITGIFEIFFLFIKVPSRFLLLQQMLLLEVIVQFIEGVFYVYWFYNFTPFNISNADFYGIKNNKKCKFNSRNFTYDGLTFSSSLFLLEDVKDEM